MRNLRYIYLVPRELKKFYYVCYNKLLFRLNGVKLGVKSKIYNKVLFFCNLKGKIVIGDNFLLTSGEGVNTLCRNNRGSIYCCKNAQLTIGNNVGMSSPMIYVAEQITIGDNVKIGADTMLLDTDSHNLDFMLRRKGCTDVPNTRPIVVGDDVLIGARSIILKGVTIGARSIIGAGSIVVKSIPEDCIAAGNPCKVIRKLNL